MTIHSIDISNIESTFIKKRKELSWEAVRDVTATEVAKYVKVLAIILIPFLLSHVKDVTVVVSAQSVRALARIDNGLKEIN